MAIDIAIIGLSGKFPDANNTDLLWNNILEKKCSIATLTDLECLASGVKEEILNKANYVKRKGVLTNSDCFDANFFQFSDTEATLLDPQYRLMLEVAYNAIENSGYYGKNEDSNFGVFLGSSSMDTYYQNVIMPSPGSFTPDGFMKSIYAKKDFLPSLISYKLGLTGPSIAIQTACSSSLVSVCIACQSLATYDSDIALAGGACITTPIHSGYLYEQGMMFSKTGNIKTFDKNADGIVLGNGAGAVVLKRLKDAINDNDNIYAVIKGIATNNDGSNQRIGYTAPSITGQTLLIKKALKSAQFNPNDIQYIETHGTGTILGDLIELNALNTVFGNCNKESIYLGSIKPNIGHLDAASGITNLIKIIYAIKHEIIPPNINISVDNQHDLLNNSAFKISTEFTKWKSNKLRTASTSSFGMGGTNAHVILQEFKKDKKTKNKKKNFHAILSAKSEQSLKIRINDLKSHLLKNKNISLHDLEYTLINCRQHFKYKYAVKFSNLEELILLLQNNENNSNKPYLSWRNESNENNITSHLKSIHGKIISLPDYPFQKNRYWYYENKSLSNFKTAKTYLYNKDANSHSDIIKLVLPIFSKFLNIEENTNIDLNKTLNILGVDSISTIFITHDISQILNFKLPINIDVNIHSINNLCAAIINCSEFNKETI